MCIDEGELEWCGKITRAKRAATRQSFADQGGRGVRLRKRSRERMGSKECETVCELVLVSARNDLKCRRHRNSIRRPAGAVKSFGKFRDEVESLDSIKECVHGIESRKRVDVEKKLAKPKTAFAVVLQVPTLPFANPLAPKGARASHSGSLCPIHANSRNQMKGLNTAQLWRTGWLEWPRIHGN